ncbi:NPCBM/NEW2 domain-containing protein [Streptomyces galilaeus]
MASYAIIGIVIAALAVILAQTGDGGAEASKGTDSPSAKVSHTNTPAPVNSTFSAFSPPASPADNRAGSTSLPTQQVKYLSDATPVGGVSAGTIPAGEVTISGVPYAHSVFVFCDRPEADIQYNLGAKSAVFATEVGIGDEQDASGIIAHASFYADDRLVKTVSVSLAHPQKVHFGVSGVVRIRLTCTLSYKDSGDARLINLAFGDARAISQ